MGVFSKAPNIVVVCVTILIGLAITGVVVLLAIGRSADELTHIINVVFQGLGVLAGSGAFLYASASAKSGHNVEKKLNGELDARIENAIEEKMGDQHGA